MFKTSNQLVQEIHNEFDTAQERLLKEAREIIANAGQFISDKAERLERIGFVNSETVVKHRENKNVLVKNKEQADLIEYYKQNYPFQKFLTESELDRICKKYDLIFAPVGNYTREVPEKNLIDIEALIPLKKEDMMPVLFRLIGIENMELINKIGKNEPVFTQKEMDDLIIKYYGHHGLPWAKEAHESTWLFVVSQKFGLDSTRFYSYKKVEKIDKTKLFIAAPVSHFNLNKLTKKGVFGYFNITITEVKDPIVFRYCRGGIQVITKWGLEGEDEGLVNEKMN